MQVIELKFNDKEERLISFEYGNRIYKEQVKDVINLFEDYPIVFCFPKTITKVSSSFIQGLFEEVIDTIGYIGFEKRVIISSRSKELSDYIRKLIW
jgi:hypothetical protein